VTVTVMVIPCKERRKEGEREVKRGGGREGRR
jgi:hypothetical protein